MLFNIVDQSASFCKLVIVELMFSENLMKSSGGNCVMPNMSVL